MEQKDTTSYDEVAAAGCLDFRVNFWHSDCSSLQHEGPWLLTWPTNYLPGVCMYLCGLHMGT